MNFSYYMDSSGRTHIKAKRAREEILSAGLSSFCFSFCLGVIELLAPKSNIPIFGSKHLSWRLKRRPKPRRIPDRRAPTFEKLSTWGSNPRTKLIIAIRNSDANATNCRRGEKKIDEFNSKGATITMRGKKNLGVEVRNLVGIYTPILDKCRKHGTE